MDDAKLIRSVILLVWTFILIIYIIVTLVVNPLTERYKYYKIKKDTAIWAEEFTRERAQNPEKYDLLDTDNVTNMRQMFLGSDQNIDISQYDIKSVFLIIEHSLEDNTYKTLAEFQSRDKIEDFIMKLDKCYKTHE